MAMTSKVRKIASRTYTPITIPEEYATANTLNPEGAPAWQPELKDHFVQTVLANILEPTFYVPQDNLIDEAKQIHQKMLVQDPEFYTRAIVYARNEGLIRIQPILGLVYLSTLQDKKYFNLAFDRVILTPDDLKNFVALAKTAGIRRGLGRSIKRRVNAWLNRMTEYHAIKYGGESEQFNLRNILRLTKPRPKDEKQRLVFAYVADKLFPKEVKAKIPEPRKKRKERSEK